MRPGVPPRPDGFRAGTRQVPVQLFGRTLVADTALLVTILLAQCFGAAVASDVRAKETNQTRFRFGFSSATFTDVNENDAKAGMKVWGQMLFKERGLPVDPEPIILKDPEAIAEALRSQSIDAITLNTDEYWKLDKELRAGPFIGGVNDGRITEEYVLLVHQDSKIERVEDLRGRSLNVFQNSRMCLAPVWLDTVLLQAGFPPAVEFCRVTPINKLAKVVLPVFFRQADACLVTRHAFKIMSELNPQVSQRLKVLAMSPELVPTGFCFRRDYTDPLKETIVAELARIKDSPAGAQVLTLFQSGSLEARPLSCLETAFELLDTHQRLCGATNIAKASRENLALDETKGAGR
jgi:ABC-type phosphate/phosphonate transport system substrate-binding protein